MLRQEQWKALEPDAEILGEQCLERSIDPRGVATLGIFLASDDPSGCSGPGYFNDAGGR